MGKVCADCIYLDWNNKKLYSSKDQRRCIEIGKYVEPTDRICNYFKEREKSDTSGCFITTVVTDILGYEDHCWILEKLRWFRNNIMQGDARFEQLLLSYDVIGPKIADAITIMPNKKEVCVLVSQYYLIPICNYIESQNYFQASSLYIAMIKFLQNQLGIEGNIEVYSYDSSVLEQEKGHGRALVRIKNI